MAQSPEAWSVFTMASGCVVVSKLSLPSPSRLTLTYSILRRSPRFTSSTLPATGEVRHIAPDTLSMSRGVPAFTLSPGLTAAFHMQPG